MTSCGLLAVLSARGTECVWNPTGLNRAASAGFEPGADAGNNGSGTLSISLGDNQSAGRAISGGMRRSDLSRSAIIGQTAAHVILPLPPGDALWIGGAKDQGEFDCLQVLVP